MAYLGAIQCFLKAVSGIAIGNTICPLLCIPVVAFLYHNTKTSMVNILSNNNGDLYAIIEQHKCLINLCKLNDIHFEDELSRYATVMLKGFLFQHLARCLDPQCPLHIYVNKNRNINAILYNAKTRANLLGNLNYFRLKKCLEIYRSKQPEIQLFMGENLMENSQKAVCVLAALHSSSVKSGIIITYQINRCM